MAKSGISEEGQLPASCAGGPEDRKERAISSIFAIGPGHGGALASPSTSWWLSVSLVAGQIHILWSLLLKNEHEIMNEKLGPRLRRGQQVTT